MTGAVISSPDDERLIAFSGLNDAEHRRRTEAGTGTFVVEGLLAIERALASPYVIETIVVTPGKRGRLPSSLPASVRVHVATQEALASVVGFAFHRGALAIGRRRAPTPLDRLTAVTSRLAVLEGVSDHENLGAIARAARALAVEGLVLDPTCCDPFYRRCIRVSMGEILHLLLTRATRWPEDLDDLRARGFTLLALTPDPEADELDAVAAELPGRLAVLLGAEGPGLSDAALAAADRQVRVPMASTGASLNVGHAAAIAFHVLRRRDHR